MADHSETHRAKCREADCPVCDSKLEEMREAVAPMILCLRAGPDREQAEVTGFG